MSNPDDTSLENKEIDSQNRIFDSDTDLSQLAEAIVDDLDIPTESKNQKIEQVIRTLSVSRQLIKSPVPPPDWLAGYKEVEPTAPERILRLAENEQQHRHAMEKLLVESQIESQRTESKLGEKEQETDRWLANRGLIFAFIIVLAFLSFIAFLIWKDKTVEAFYSAMIGLAVLIANFIFRSRIFSSDRNGKNRDKT